MSSNYALMVIFWVIFIVIIMRERRNIAVILHKIRKKRGKFVMTEMIEKYIGKECLIYTCSSSTQITGVIRLVKDGWIEVENNGQCDIINCEYIVRIREYPRNKKGKKKGIILD